MHDRLGAAFVEDAAAVSTDTAVALMVGYFGGVLAGGVLGSRLARQYDPARRWRRARRDRRHGSSNQSTASILDPAAIVVTPPLEFHGQINSLLIDAAARILITGSPLVGSSRN